MTTTDEIDEAIREAANDLLQSDVPPELVVDSLMAFAIALGVKLAGPAHVARQLMTNAEELLDQARSLHRHEGTAH